MSEIFERIRDLVKKGSVRISEHGYDELSVDGLTARELVNGVATGEMLENYRTFERGHAVSFYSTILTDHRYMLFGMLRKNTTRPLYS